MTVGIIAEKPSAAQNFARALGGMSGTFEGMPYRITVLSGHLLEFEDPAKMCPPDQAKRYASWDLENLPWDLSTFTWTKKPRTSIDRKTHRKSNAYAKAKIAEVKRDLTGVDEIVIATDVDPSGEGGLLAAEVLIEIGRDKGTKISRMYFTNESVASDVQKGFRERKTIPDLYTFDEYRAADFRSKFDLGTVQFTRIAKKMSGQVLRQGRLKSAMVLIVGDRLKEVAEYRKQPFFQNRFRDENQVVYTNPNEPRFATKSEVPTTFTKSKVVLDSRENKRTAPPKLLDLAMLSAMLSSRGYKTKGVLATYQKMYEAGVVSYPRTEDKTITNGQFDELLPHVDKIASVVGADVSALTHRTARPTHVQDKGAHGANRPGLSVPATLDELTKFGPEGPAIYEALAKSYLSMLAEDYVYEQQKGHLDQYPDYVGTANVPKSLGWRGIFVMDDESGPDEDENASGLGTMAEPFIYEGANPKPSAPTQMWLMQQLRKRNVGTGATQSQIFTDVTSTQHPVPLLLENKGKLSMTQFGKMSYMLLPNTHIGDLSMTEELQADMKKVAKGELDPEVVFARLADWVRDDIETMKANAVVMRRECNVSDSVMADRYEGEWQGKSVRFKRDKGGHKFSDEECESLCKGETVPFTGVSQKSGKEYKALATLAEQTFTNDQGKEVTFVGIKMDFDNAGSDGPMPKWGGHTFTDVEMTALKNGQTIERDDWVSAKTGKPFTARVKWAVPDGETHPKMIASFGSSKVPQTAFGHTFTEEERVMLEAGKHIRVEGFVSKKSGKTYSCDDVSFGSKPGEDPTSKQILLNFDK